jgi:hypothetical protein
MAGTSAATTVFQRFFASLPVMAALGAAIHVSGLKRAIWSMAGDGPVRAMTRL